MSTFWETRLGLAMRHTSARIPPCKLGRGSCWTVFVTICRYLQFVSDTRGKAGRASTIPGFSLFGTRFRRERFPKERKLGGGTRDRPLLLHHHGECLELVANR